MNNFYRKIYQLKMFAFGVKAIVARVDEDKGTSTTAAATVASTIPTSAK